MNNLKIVTSKNIKIEDEGLYVYTTNNQYGFCPLEEISDINLDINKYFNKYKNYKFYVCQYNEDGSLILSYKKCHPNFNLKKKKIYPTASHFNNLSEFIKNKIDEYDL